MPRILSATAVSNGLATPNKEFPDIGLPAFQIFQTFVIWVTIFEVMDVLYCSHQYSGQLGWLGCLVK